MVAYMEQYIREVHVPPRERRHPHKKLVPPRAMLPRGKLKLQCFVFMRHIPRVAELRYSLSDEDLEVFKEDACHKRYARIRHACREGRAYLDSPLRDCERGPSLQRVSCRSFGNGRAARAWSSKRRVQGRVSSHGRVKLIISLPPLTASLVRGWAATIGF